MKQLQKDQEVFGQAHGGSVKQQGTDPKILVAETSLENLEGEPAFCKRFNWAWPPRIPDAFMNFVITAKNLWGDPAGATRSNTICAIHNAKNADQLVSIASASIT